jgi:flagellar biogenesis protein FliO
METIRQTGAVALVMALLLLTLWWLRKRGIANLAGALPGVLPGVLSNARKSAVKRLQSLERLPLGPQHTLHLIRCGDAELLISSSPSGCALLANASGSQPGAPFSACLREESAKINQITGGAQ